MKQIIEEKDETVSVENVSQSDYIGVETVEERRFILVKVVKEGYGLLDEQTVHIIKSRSESRFLAIQDVIRFLINTGLPNIKGYYNKARVYAFDTEKELLNWIHYGN